MERLPGAGVVVAGLFVALSGLFLPARSDAANKLDDANRRLTDLEERVRVIAAEFRDNPTPDANVADRRVLDAELLYNLKNYGEAATILLDVIEKYPSSRAYDDAVVLLGESLYQDRDLNSARRYFELAIQKNTGSRKEQAALQRLVEIALRTGDYDNVENYLGRLERIPPHLLEPSVPYVRGKYLYFRDKPDDALAVFANVAPTNPYYPHARYFMATIHVKKGDLAAAITGFDAVLRAQPRTDADKEVQNLARLAIGRLHYERGQFDKAKEAYAAVPRQSVHFTEAMYESAWNAIKARDFKAAYRSLDLMMLQNPDAPQGPELRLLMGNLNLRLSNFFVASETFSRARDEFDPIHRQLQVTLRKGETDAKYYESLLGKGMEKFDIALFIPASAVRWVKTEPDIARMINLADELGDLQRGIRDSEQTLIRLERAIGGAGKVGIFPDLAAQRLKSTEILNQTVEVRRQFLGQMRKLITSGLGVDEKTALDQVASERSTLERQLKDMPVTGEGLRGREQSTKGRLQELDNRASEFNVQIQAMEAELVAIEQYFIHSRADQKIRPEDLRQPVGDMRAEIVAMRESLDRIRNEIAETSRETTIAGAAGVNERSATVRLLELMKREHDIFLQARFRLDSKDKDEFDQISSILVRADTVQSRLFDFDGRVDSVADRRLAEIRERLASEKVQLQSVNSKLSGVLTESQSLGGGLAQIMLAKVTDRFYGLVVQSDVGLVDVAWGLKDQKTSTLSKLINQQKLELKSVEDDFRSLLEEGQ